MCIGSLFWEWIPKNWSGGRGRPKQERRKREAIQGCVIALIKLGTTMGDQSGLCYFRSRIECTSKLPTERMEEQSISPPPPACLGQRLSHEVLVPSHFQVYAQVRMAMGSCRDPRLKWQRSPEVGRYQMQLKQHVLEYAAGCYSQAGVKRWAG